MHSEWRIQLLPCEHLGIRRSDHAEYKECDQCSHAAERQNPATVTRASAGDRWLQ